MKFLDLFSGIGGFRLGMEMAGHECVGHCEIDKYADKSYRAMHNVKENEFYANDITRIEPGDLPEADVYCGGFPCQSFSIAGKRGGFEDTRGTLFFEVMRLAVVRKPKYLFLENVKGLLSHDGGKTFGTILETLWECGYDAEWQVCNSKYWVPQNRERIFIIGHLRGECTSQVFPITEVGGTDDGIQRQEVGTIRARYGNDGTGGYILTQHKQPAQVKPIGNTNPSGNGMNGEVYDSNGLCPTLTTNKGEGNKIAIPVLTPDREEKRQNGRRFKDDGDEMFTLTSQDRHGVVVEEPRVSTGIKESVRKNFNREYQKIIETDKEIYMCECESGWQDNKVGIKCSPTLRSGNTHTSVLAPNLTIRKLTPRECFRLQGFPDEYFNRAASVNSDSQLYKQAGNSVTVNVIYEIARRLK